MAVGLGRFSILRDGSTPRSGPSNRGLVVEAVLVMALVTTIGIFVIASRVAGSRQSASSSSLSLAARQAAEFGFSEVIAEMNRDPKSYLWVTKFEKWNYVSAQDLKDCGVAAMADPAINPISSLGSERALPNSPELSYRFKRYIEPAKEPKEPNPTPDPSAPAVPEVCNSKFGNLIGGTGEIEIVGTMNRGSGYTSTFTLKRKVSVKRAAPIFNNPITAIPANRSFDPADSRFPNYIDAADPTKVAYPGKPVEKDYIPITCSTGSSSSVIKCTDESTGLSQDFNSETGAGIYDFPYTTKDQVWPAACQNLPEPPDEVEVVRCYVTSMNVTATMYVTTNRPSDNKKIPVEFFLAGDMIISKDSKLSGFGCPSSSWSAALGCTRPRLPDNIDPLAWSRFRIFGVTTGTSCGSQTITINPTPSTIPPTPRETNLQNAFLWLNKGKLIYQTSTALDRIPALVGSVCEFKSAVAGPATLSTLSNRRFLEVLGGAYGFSGLFGSPTPIRFFYRGFGFEDERISS